MSRLNFLKDCKLSRVANSATAGTTTITSSVLDMTGYDSVVFIAAVGDVTSGSVLTLTVKENTANSTSSPTPTASTGGATDAVTAGASDTDNKLFVSDVFRPAKQYVFCTLARATQNAVVDGIFAIQYNSKALPITQPSDIVASVFAMNG